MRKFRRAMVTAGAWALTSALAPEAKADAVRLTVDWNRVLKQGESWVIAQAETEREPAPRSLDLTRSTSSAALGSAWVGVAPNVSLVARDWGAARRLAGGPLALTDALRVSRSCRMVMTRMRLGEGRLVPFAQLGLGQWRVDTDFVPHLPRDVELAAQFGAGVEMRLLPGWELAAETDLTVLYREEHEAQQISVPRMWGTFLASRVQF